MAKNPTVAQLIAKAIELNCSLTEAQAAELIKSADARSYKKVAEAVEAAKKTRKTRGTAAIVEPGPRGFRFGSTYVQSIIDGAGIAAKDSNKKKLIAFAETVGVSGITMKTDVTDAFKSLKAAAKKFLSTNFETA